ncbi:MAG: universal stress protein [Thermodesulfovibrionales bacterium]|jgi:nucleotide-binding universal stress UspA family protein
MKVVFATDGSTHSEDAAHFLKWFHFSPEDEFIVLHVVTEIPYDDDWNAGIKRVIKKVAPRILKSAVNALGPLKAKITLVEEEGAPDEVIMKVADDLEADLIVMGARGVTGVKSFFIGSMTMSVAINSSRPLLVTKPSHRRISQKMNVLFATDGSAFAHATAMFLASMPLPPDTEVTVMNVAWSAISDIPERYSLEIDDHVKKDLAKARSIEFEKSEEIIDQARPYLSRRFGEIKRVTKGGDPSSEILREAEIVNADIIAVGSRGVKGMRGMLGSVSRRLLSHAQCAVLVGKMRVR